MFRENDPSVSKFFCDKICTHETCDKIVVRLLACKDWVNTANVLWYLALWSVTSVLVQFLITLTMVRVFKWYNNHSLQLLLSEVHNPVWSSVIVDINKQLVPDKSQFTFYNRCSFNLAIMSILQMYIWLRLGLSIYRYLRIISTLVVITKNSSSFSGICDPANSTVIKEITSAKPFV